MANNRGVAIERECKYCGTTKSENKTNDGLVRQCWYKNGGWICRHCYIDVKYGWTIKNFVLNLTNINNIIIGNGVIYNG